MSKKIQADDFLKNMAEIEEPPTKVPPQLPKSSKPITGSRAPSYRAMKKHIGGYFEAETLERIALLRARLGLDNSELLKLAVDELFAKERAKRAFND